MFLNSRVLLYVTQSTTSCVQIVRFGNLTSHQIKLSFRCSCIAKHCSFNYTLLLYIATNYNIISIDLTVFLRSQTLLNINRYAINYNSNFNSTNCVGVTKISVKCFCLFRTYFIDYYINTERGIIVFHHKCFKGEFNYVTHNSSGTKKKTLYLRSIE